MSFQSQEAKTVAQIISMDKVSPFEKHIINCCKAPEWELRKWLKKVLIRAGFEIFEDGYKSDRCAKDDRYSTVHNMLAIRGEKPAVCFGAHTDICRDHSWTRTVGKYSVHDDAHWLRDQGEDKSATKGKRKDYIDIQPVVKVAEDPSGALRRIVQDKACKFQVGGDDRLGVAINTYIACNSGIDMGLVFFTDEEVGLKSAAVIDFPQLKEFEIIIETDRGNHSNELVVKIGDTTLADYPTIGRLLEVAFDMGMPRVPVCGMGTDIAAVKRRGNCKNAANLTCGYHSSNGDSGDEYIDVSEAYDTMRWLSAVAKDYYLNGV
jgi:hypothetical protein